MGSDGLALVRDAEGSERPLGDWLGDLLARSEQSVTRAADRAHLSRSFYYLVLKGHQVPSVESLASLLEALDVDDVRLASPSESGDLVCVVDGRRFSVVLPRSGRRAVRSRNALYTLATKESASSPIVNYMMGPAESPPVRAGAADERTRLIAELLHNAADLDLPRLRLLVAHAELLARD